jgi:hypothetical protein
LIIRRKGWNVNFLVIFAIVTFNFFFIDLLFYISKNYIGLSEWELAQKQEAFQPNSDRERMLQNMTAATASNNGHVDDSHYSDGHVDDSHYSEPGIPRFQSTLNHSDVDLSAVHSLLNSSIHAPASNSVVTNTGLVFDTLDEQSENFSGTING